MIAVIPNTWIGGNRRSEGIGQTCAIRCGDYKLVYWYKDGKKELYNIVDDISESKDLSLQLPDVVEELSKKLGGFLRSAGGQRPSFKKDGSLCPWSDEVFD